MAEGVGFEPTGHPRQPTVSRPCLLIGTSGAWVAERAISYLKSAARLTQPISPQSPAANIWFAIPFAVTLPILQASAPLSLPPGISANLYSQAASRVKPHQPRSPPSAATRRPNA